jgi:two-component system CheB/CheR fusion protein
MKYGALRSEAGRIALSWEESGGMIRLRWRETGVRIEDTAPKRGVGSSIIVDTLPYMLGGTASLTFHPDGVQCVLEFPTPPEVDEPAHG